MIECQPEGPYNSLYKQLQAIRYIQGHNHDLVFQWGGLVLTSSSVGPNRKETVKYPRLSLRNSYHNTKKLCPCQTID